MFHVSAHGHAQLDWRDDFKQQRTYVTDRHLYNEFPVNRSYFDHELKPEEGLPGTLPQEFFFIATGIWPLERKPPRPDERPYVLREVAISKEYSFVRPQQENVGGRWCHVLEWPGYDRLWIDVDRGCSLLARESCSKANGALVQRIELGDHHEIAPNIWLPGWMQNIQFDYNAPSEQGRKRRVVDARHTILATSVNDVDDAIFQFTPRPGALHISSDKSPSQTEPGGLDHLEVLAQWVEKYAVISKPSPGLFLSYLAGMPVLLIILVWECLIRWRGRSCTQADEPCNKTDSEQRALADQHASGQL